MTSECNSLPERKKVTVTHEIMSSQWKDHQLFLLLRKWRATKVELCLSHWDHLIVYGMHDDQLPCEPRHFIRIVNVCERLLSQSIEIRLTCDRCGPREKLRGLCKPRLQYQTVDVGVVFGVLCRVDRADGAAHHDDILAGHAVAGHFAMDHRGVRQHRHQQRRVLAVVEAVAAVLDEAHVVAQPGKRGDEVLADEAVVDALTVPMVEDHCAAQAVGLQRGAGAAHVGEDGGVGDVGVEDGIEGGRRLWVGREKEVS